MGRSLAQEGKIGCRARETRFRASPGKTGILIYRQDAKKGGLKTPVQKQRKGTGEQLHESID
jgi:hypothetical protein